MGTLSQTNNIRKVKCVCPERSVRPHGVAPQYLITPNIDLYQLCEKVLFTLLENCLDAPIYSVKGDCA
ncbi:Uncharacterised protein [Halioglobus japonicus]|nr:Uncharacterised protein [Halioglobus japonicus]